MINTGAIQLDFDYSSPEIEDIKRCLTTLYTTREGEQPLDRDFGLRVDFLSEPLPVAQSKFALEVVRKTAIYEPRARVKEVTYTQDEVGGQMIPKVHLAKGDGAIE